MQKTKIEWVRNPDGSQGYSWNPIKGICPVECPYCYATKIYQRFSRTRTPWLDHNEFGQPKAKKPKGVFVCSTFELFHPMTLEVNAAHGKTWRDIIFFAIEHTPNNRFYILTKFPQNIDRPMPDNVWLGVSITKDEDIWRRNRLVTTDAKIKFISFEPLLGEIDVKYGLLQRIDWVIIGRLTQYGKKYDPTKKQLSKMIWGIRGNPLGYSPPIFLKDNLKEIWGEPLIQEMPK